MNESWEWEDWALKNIQNNVQYHNIVKVLNKDFKERGRRGYDIHDVVLWAGKAQKRQSYYPLKEPAKILQFKKKE